MANNTTFTAKDLNRIFQSGINPNLRKLHVIESHAPQQGGMSNGVFEAEIEGSKKRWALKVIDAKNFARLDSGESSRLLTERQNHWDEIIRKEAVFSRDISSLRNQYFVQAAECYELSGLYLIRMPFYKGLADYCGEPEDTTLRLGRDLCHALLALHFDDRELGPSRHGVMLHGDIKPQNIFYSSSDGIVHFMLGDFGSVHHQGEPCQSRSAGYYPPEAQLGSTSVRPCSDLFSLGMTLYWYVCGKDDQQEYQMWKARSAGKTSDRPAACSDELWELILDATMPAPEERIQTAGQFLERLDSVHKRKNTQLQKTNDAQENAWGLAASLAVSLAAGALAKKATQTVRKRLNTKRIDYEETKSWYEGDVRHNQPCGNGTFHFSDEESLSGTWSYADREGGGLLGYDIASYSGTFCGNTACGFAVIRAEIGWVYRGEFRDGRFGGQGQFTFHCRGEDITISGVWQFIKAMKLNVDSGERIYKGMLCNGHPNGPGQLEIPGAGNFFGIFCDKGFCVGCMEWDSGERYDGELLYINGRLKVDGEGTFTDSDGNSTHAIWKDGKPIQAL